MRFAAAMAVMLALIGQADAAEPTPVGLSSCSGCHATGATVETPVPRLVGRNPAEIVAAMQEFRSGKRPTTVMDRIVRGFSDDEIEAIAAWYGAQRD